MYEMNSIDITINNGSMHQGPNIDDQLKLQTPENVMYAPTANA